MPLSSLQRHFRSLRSTRSFMLAFGLAMGALFPLYSSLFFGSAAFHPLYAAGCLVAGLLVALFCYWSIKQVLALQVERQCHNLAQVIDRDPLELLPAGEDQVVALVELQELLTHRLGELLRQITGTVVELHPIYQALDAHAQGLAEGNRSQAATFEQTAGAARQMNQAFADMLRHIEEVTNRAGERASLATEISAATDGIAESVEHYNASILETSAAIEEMAASLRETSGNIDELAQSAEQTSGSILQVSATTGQMQENARSSADASGKVRLQAEEGLEAMSRMQDAVRNIEQSSSASRDAIRRLLEHTDQIGSFLSIITEIVEQTNLLSLNASIIAAQAGEKGRSFAVVAEEIRSLAQRTAASTTEISLLVENIQRDTSAADEIIRAGADTVRAGVETSGRTHAALQKILESAAEASAMVERIAQGTVEQAAGTSLIARESEKNLDRLRHARKSVQEQEQRTFQIVQTLEQMKALAQQIQSATSEQAKGNRHYLRSVQEDSERAARLREAALQQVVYGDQVEVFVKEAGDLLETNSLTAETLLSAVAEAVRLTGRLDHAMEALQTLEHKHQEPG